MRKAALPPLQDRISFLIHRGVRNFFVGNRLIWVAVIEELVVGFTDLEPSGHLDNMNAHPEHEGRGVASALLACLEAAARSVGLTRIFTEASITAKPFFERRGSRVLTDQVVEFRGEKLKNYRVERLLTEPPPA